MHSSLAKRDPITARRNRMAPARFSFLEGVAMIASARPVQQDLASNGMTQSLAAASAAARKRHQDDLLDEALLETFPASDPVSVVRVE